MWRPVALSAFLALLFMSSRSGQTPIETNTNDLAKTDFGASAAQDSGKPRIIEIDISQSSAHPRTPPPQQSAGKAQDAETEERRTVSVAAADMTTGDRRTIPLPDPKAKASEGGTRVVVTQGEQKTALTTDTDALNMIPPGPDFAAKVQQELVRLGCYKGRVDNIWGPMSRNAVARFNRVAKAKLPLKQPSRALLSSARKAPDGYCTNGGAAGSRVAALDPGTGLEELKNRPSYLPPWMRGEPMPEPEPQEEQADGEDTPQASPESSGTAARTQRSEPTRTRRTTPTRTRRARVRTRQAQRRQVRRRSSSFRSALKNWPGQ